MMRRRPMMMESICLNDSELLHFRTEPCAIKSVRRDCPNRDDCPSSHCLSWCRRNPATHAYGPRLCPLVEFRRDDNSRTRVQNFCTKGRACEFAHTKEEQMYHPNIYKTKVCKAWPRCPRAYCPFAHGSSELRPLHPDGEGGGLSSSSGVDRAHSTVADDLSQLSVLATAPGRRLPGGVMLKQESRNDDEEEVASQPSHSASLTTTAASAAAAEDALALSAPAAFAATGVPLPASPAQASFLEAEGGVGVLAGAGPAAGGANYAYFGKGVQMHPLGNLILGSDGHLYVRVILQR